MHALTNLDGIVANQPASGEPPPAARSKSLPSPETVQFVELFDLQQIQKLQDQFALATGVASIITHPDGKPITQPSNFCRLCQTIIRGTVEGLRHCHRSDAALGRQNPEGPIIKTCLSGGLWDAGASLTVGGRHIANWLIGQVRNEAQEEAAMRRYAREIGVDEQQFMAAYAEVPCMPLEQFKRVAEALFTLAGQLSAAAYQNLLQARLIAELNKTQEALEVSEARYRLLAENVSDVIWVADVETERFTYVSPSVERLRDFKPEEVLTMDLKTAIAPAFYQRLHAQLPDRIERFHRGQDITYSDEVQQPRKGGGTVWTEAVSRIRRNPRTGRLELYGTTRNISARKHAEEALRSAKLDMETAQAAGHVGSWSRLAGPTGLLQWSAECCRIFGVAPEEFDGRLDTFWQRVHPEDLPFVRAASHAALKGERPYNVEHRIVRPDGEVRWVRQQAKLENDPAGQPLRMVGLIQDITEHRLALERLRESEDRFRTAIESAPEAIFVQTDRRFAYVNQTALQYFGATSPDQLLDRPVLERFHPDFHPVIEARIRTLMEELKPVPAIEERCIRLDGTSFEVEVSAVPFAFKGRQGALVFLRDVSSRKRLEEQLQQAQKMEAIGQLAGGVAHDFNNILAAMLMQVNLLQASADLSAEVRETLELVERGAHRAANLTRQLLLFSRRSVIQLQPLDLNAVVDNLLKMLRRLLGEHIHLEWHAACGLPSVQGDAGLLEQVVTNLCVNARDAMPGGGRLTLATSLVEFGPGRLGDERRAGKSLCLSVTDTGCGMDERTLSRIFEPFFTTKEVGKGTGLGLATVHGIVKQHGGWVEVESAPGQGTTFHVFLPAADRPSAESLAPALPPPQGGSETILLVEDEEGVRDILVRSLARQGYHVLQAANGPEALKIWRDERDAIALLFTDMVMPGGMTGLELAERLRSDVPSLPVIISTGYSTDLIRPTTASEAGVTLFPKPFNLASLASAVRNCLDNRPAAGPT